MFWHAASCFGMRNHDLACRKHVSACSGSCFGMQNHVSACRIMIWHAEIMFRHAKIMGNQWEINGGSTGPAGSRVPPGLAKRRLLVCWPSAPLTSSSPPWGHRAPAGAPLGKKLAPAHKDHVSACKIMIWHAESMFRHAINHVLACKITIWHAESMFRHAES